MLYMFTVPYALPPPVQPFHAQFDPFHFYQSMILVVHVQIVSRIIVCKYRVLLRDRQYRVLATILGIFYTE